MAAPSPSSALDMDNPEMDAHEAFQGLTEAEREQHEKIPVNVNVDDATVLKESEIAAPGPIGESLAARVHEAATKARKQPAVMEVTPEEAERIQEAESRVVHAKESAEQAASPTPQARVFP